MPDNPAQTGGRKAETEAAAWLARRDAGLSGREEGEFRAWLAADPRHAAAWEELQTAWTVFDRPRRLGAAAAMIGELHARGRRRMRWRAGLGAAAAGIAAAAAAWIFLLRPPATAPAGPGSLATPVVLRAERFELPDHSVAELNRGARIDVGYGADRRDVRLVSGEAYFTVVASPTRPFVVTAGSVQVRAVGTAFAVRMGPENTDVLVTDGRVAVYGAEVAPRRAEPVAPKAPPAPAPIVVSTHDHLVVPASAAKAPPRPEPLPAAEIERRLEWRQTRVELSGTPLGAAVDVFNREARVRLTVRDPALANLRMSGVFRADNVEGFVRLLQSNYGVRVERRGDEIVLQAAR